MYKKAFLFFTATQTTPRIFKVDVKIVDRYTHKTVAQDSFHHQIRSGTLKNDDIIKAIKFGLMKRIPKEFPEIAQAYKFRWSFEGPFEEKKPVKETMPKSERLYEVCFNHAGQVWTIVKHKQPFYSEEEAKTVLMAKIVNGEN